MIFQLVVGKVTSDLTWTGRFSSHPLQQTLLLSRERWSGTHWSYRFYSKESLPVHREQELNLRALKMQTSNPGFGQSQTFSNLTWTTKPYKTYLTTAILTCWVICTGGGNFLSTKIYPAYPTHPTNEKTPIDSSTAELGWSWTLLKFHLSNYNWKITADSTYTFPKPGA